MMMMMMMLADVSFLYKGTEGRSPLQILKETNSPMNQRSQVLQTALQPAKPQSRTRACHFTELT